MSTLREQIKDAIANGVNPALLPGLDKTTDRVLAVVEAHGATRRLRDARRDALIPLAERREQVTEASGVVERGGGESPGS